MMLDEAKAVLRAAKRAHVPAVARKPASAPVYGGTWGVEIDGRFRTKDHDKAVELVARAYSVRNPGAHGAVLRRPVPNGLREGAV
jgi:hypothetical protein